MSNASGTPVRPATVAATAQIGAGSLVPMPNGFGAPVRPATVAATVGIGARAGQTIRTVGFDAVLVPGQERRALFHVPREEWTAARVQVLVWRMVTGWTVGMVLIWSVWPMWLAGDREALPTLIEVVGAWVAVDAWLRRRLPPGT